MKKLLCFLFCFSLFNSWAQNSFPAQFMHVDKLVRGTFTHPTHLPGPYATVLIVPGSGANDRHGTLLLAGGYAPCLYPQLLGQTLYPYRDLADALVAAGYAVLRYDKLEYSYPTNLGSISFNKLWLPALSGIDWLKGRAEVDTNQLILLGHSEGSSLIPYMAQGRSDIHALVSLAGSVTPFDSVLGRQLVDFAQQCGGNVLQAQTEADQILTYFNVIRAGNPPATTPSLFGVPAASWRQYVLATDTVAGLYNAAVQPALFVGLGADLNVPPSELVRFQAAVTRSNDFWLLPDVNHFLSTNSDPAFVATVADTIVHWLRQSGVFTSVSPAAQSLEGVRIFPNPARDFVEVQWERSSGEALTYVLCDLQGRVLLAGTAEVGASALRLDLRDQAPGLYVLRLRQGKELAARKLLLQPE